MLCSARFARVYALASCIASGTPTAAAQTSPAPVGEVALRSLAASLPADTVDSAELARLEARVLRRQRPPTDEVLSLANLYLRLDRPRDAIAALLPALHARRTSAATFASAVQLCFAAGDVPRARAVLAQARARHGDDPALDRPALYLAAEGGRVAEFDIDGAPELYVERQLLDAVQRAGSGDLVGAVLVGELTRYDTRARQSNLGTAGLLATLVYSLYRECLHRTLVGEPWAVTPYPPGTFAAAYLGCLRDAFAEVAGEVGRYGAEPFVIYAAAARANELYFARGFGEAFAEPFPAVVRRLREGGVYEPQFPFAAATNATDFYPFYRDEHEAERTSARAFVEEHRAWIAPRLVYPAVGAADTQRDER